MKVAKSVMVGVLALALLVPAAVVAQSKFGIFLEDIIVDVGTGQELDSYLTALEEFGFHGSVLVAVGDAVILHNAYGLADAEKGIHNHTTTAFGTGSLTRLFTAAAVIRQIDELIIAPDDPLDRFFNDIPSDKMQLTLHDLLTGSSGLVWNDDWSTADMKSDEIVAMILEQPLQFATGSKSEYSRADYFLLGRTVEIVTDQGLEEYFRNKEFVKQWMSRTGITMPFYVDSLVSRSCVPDVPQATAPEYVRAHYELLGTEGVVSTVGDLYRWWKGLFDGDMVGAKGREMMFTPYVPCSDGSGAATGYGWQIVQSRTGDTLRFVSDFVEPNGWGCALYNYREANTTIVVMSNCPFGEGNPADIVACNLSAITIGDRKVAAPTEEKPLDCSIKR